MLKKTPTHQQQLQAGMVARSGANMAEAMAAAQAERDRVKKLREEGKKDVGLPQKKVGGK